MDNKCAPSKKYINGSCFTLNSLKKIALNYNKKNNDNIDVNLPKNELVKILENKLSNKCSNQTCWLRLDFVKEIEDNDIHENTFRPKGPNTKYEWLSTTHINEVIYQYQNKYKEFLFLGAVPYDFEDLKILGLRNINLNELLSNNKYKLGMVINLDEHYKSGSHWVALYIDLKKNQIYFFDSVGKKPRKRIRKFINKIFKFLYYQKYHKNININDIINGIGKYKNIIKEFDIKYNHIQHQFKDTECGVYSINFIVRLVGGETFYDIINNITNDDKMNECRKTYFI
jgi:hypothetical protein